jgi:hypothetical protein
VRTPARTICLLICKRSGTGSAIDARRELQPDKPGGERLVLVLTF